MRPRTSGRLARGRGRVALALASGVKRSVGLSLTLSLAQTPALTLTVTLSLTLTSGGCLSVALSVASCRSSHPSSPYPYLTPLAPNSISPL